jgi:uncharacterized protein YebE (UPF0316 family)
MESTVYNNDIFSFVILPLLIFLARIFDVSINTIRIIYVLGGRRVTATLLGFFESFIWLMAIRQIFEHLDNWLCYIAYPAGFACGILVGMLIEERIAYGKVIVRIITRKDTQTLQSFLIEQGFRFTVVNGIGAEGPEHVVFTVLERQQLENLLIKLKEIIPSAFYTVEKVNRAAESLADASTPEQKNYWKWLKRSSA